MCAGGERFIQIATADDCRLTDGFNFRKMAMARLMQKGLFWNFLS